MIPVFACLSSSVPEIVSGQQLNALPVEDTLHNRVFPDWSLFEFSPDERWLLYVVQDDERARSNDRDGDLRGGIPGYGRGTDIWILNLESGAARNLTSEKGDNWLPKWSPDGHFLAFLSDRDGSGQARLWVWDAMKNDLRKVSDTELKQWFPIEWAPDSHSVFVTAMPPSPPPELSVKRIQPTAEGRKTSLGNVQSPKVVVYESNRIKRGDERASTSDPWDLNDSLRNLVRVDIVTGQTTLVVHDQRVQTYRLSPDGLSLGYTVPKRFEKPGSQQILFDLVVLTIATMQERIVAKDIRLWFEGDFSWSPDGTILTYRTGGPDQELMHDCYVVSAKGGSPRNITHFSTPKRSSGMSKVSWWNESGSHIYFIDDGALWQASPSQDRATALAQITHHKMGWRSFPQSETSLDAIDDDTSVLVVAHDDEGQQEGFYKINLTNGDITRLLEEGQCYTCGNAWLPYVVTRDRHHVAYVAEDAQHGFDLWLSDTAFKAPRRLTHLNPQFDKYRLGSAQLIDWLSDDGERLQGALLLPSDYQGGKRYPLIVGVWGGKQLSRAFHRFGFVWTKIDEKFTEFNMHLLATRGYAVLLPDSPRLEGKPMAELAKTVLPGVNKVINMGIADPDSIGLMGLNNGGGIDDVLALIVQTRRFKAAVDVGGTGDLAGLYGDPGKTEVAPEIDAIERVMGGTPWQVPARYRENSPFFYLDRVETPLLILRSARDGSGLKFSGDQTFVSLRRLGKDVEYARYEDEDHFPRSYANQLDYSNRILTWFDKYLKPSPK